MGVAFRIVRRLALTVVVFDGRVTAAEWLQNDRDVYAHPDWSPGPLNLTDVSTADISALTLADRVEILAANGLQSEFLEGMRSAVVAGPNFDSSRAFRTDDDPGLRLVVFSNLHLACAWLDVDVERVLPIVTELRGGIRQSQ